MKRKLIFLIMILIVCGFFALPAYAIRYEAEITADCDGYEITVNGSSWIVYSAAYKFTITDSQGNQTPVTGSFDIDPGPINKPNITVSGVWGNKLCGTIIISAVVELTTDAVPPENSSYYPTYPSFTFTYESPKIKCKCVPCGECKGKVTELTLKYNGTDAAVVEVQQKKSMQIIFSGLVQPGDTFTFTGTEKHATMGTDILIFVDGILNTKIHTSCSQPIGPGLISGDFMVIAGYSRNGGPLCPAIVKPPSSDGCGCRGKVTELTLKYLGGESSQITVMQKKPKDTVFDGVVEPGGEFTFSGMDKKGTLGTEIMIFVDGILNTKIHTSCSKPIGPGLVKGSFLVVSGFSRTGGPLCPLPPCETCNRSAGKIANTASSVSTVFSLSDNFPNPFNPTTTISFSLPYSSNVTLKIYNMLGKHIATLVDGTFSVGVHSVEWNASEYASGIYFYRLEAGSFVQTKKFMLMK